MLTKRGNMGKSPFKPNFQYIIKEVSEEYGRHSRKEKTMVG